MIPPGLKIDTRTQKIVRGCSGAGPGLMNGKWQELSSGKVMTTVIEVGRDGETRGASFVVAYDDLADLSLLEELAFAASQ